MADKGKFSRQILRVLADKGPSLLDRNRNAQPRDEFVPVHRMPGQFLNLNEHAVKTNRALLISILLNLALLGWIISLRIRYPREMPGKAAENRTVTTGAPTARHKLAAQLAPRRPIASSGSPERPQAEALVERKARQPMGARWLAGADERRGSCVGSRLSSRRRVCGG